MTVRPPSAIRRSLSSRARLLPALALSPMLAVLAACGSSPHSADAGLAMPKNHLLSEDRSASGGDDQIGNSGVNAYLWRGAIDTLSFMPFASADAVGGVILTDWYTPPATKNERFKITAYVLSRNLRSDAIRVSVFRQAFTDGQWTDTPVAPNTVSDITSRILTRARQLRADSGGH
ncbi:conserved hypothetical protein [Gluconacetobacter diazotrophicus PA1 5]|uniref:Uncharacterized protein n=1 Tax=Gluconacetobacter diazotrophicus (strain ATCC 49037 / DSM 5601 / CCUG 37298 / CIP 103539 / LMG 7603 / PAl5) TaxID=272568 RepID=A9HMQ3_GLUDA|nr:DUF3576 domain-containing protein [Gluconacetobacter diazotrophicus]ACI50428.1 conserved hypothetical protein [Gluconacetobacter diazotrophicus PA1 5]TWB08277.1 uncharacterized protein DUF3576 [Gluconacetobacter diazotrophicus]CAP56335.1 conserved hypothetical protein [Gluconacetobacter diazotrophicus PA1 5]